VPCSWSLPVRGPFGVGINGTFAPVSPDNKVNGIKIDATSKTNGGLIAKDWRPPAW
jgi:hypothetical protein